MQRKNTDEIGRLFRIEDAAKECGICRDVVYKLLKSGELEGRHVGLGARGTRVTEASIIRYKAKLPKYDPDSDRYKELRKKQGKGVKRLAAPTV